MSLVTTIKDLFFKKHVGLIHRFGSKVTEAQLSAALGIDAQGHTILKKKVAGDTIANKTIFEDQSAAVLKYKDSAGTEKTINDAVASNALYPKIFTSATLPVPDETITGIKKGDVFIGSTGRFFVSKGTSYSDFIGIPILIVGGAATPTGVIPVVVADKWLGTGGSLYIAKGITADTDWVLVGPEVGS